MRVFAISDIHIDYSENEKWLRSISAYDYTNDILIVAGDISDDMALLENAFGILGARFNKIVFVPGNHDLWTRKDKQMNSFEKYLKIYNAARNYGILMEPLTMGELKIIPLLGWYDYSFGHPSSQLKEMWMDYYVCKWPVFMNHIEIAQRWFNMNLDSIREHEKDQNKYLITVSHFLPRVDLLPPYLPQDKQFLTPVLGSVRIEEQIRKLGSQIHIYGHSHINMSVEKDGVLYTNNAYGYPSESYTHKSLQLVFEMT